MVNQLSARIKLGLNITMAEFCEKHLKTDYRTFQYRMRRNSYKPAEVIYICWVLNDTCENIFMQSYTELVLLKDAPGITADFIREKLVSCTPEEKKRLLDLVGMSASFFIPPSATGAPSTVEVKLSSAIDFKPVIKESFDGKVVPMARMDEVGQIATPEPPAPKKVDSLPMAEDLINHKVEHVEEEEDEFAEADVPDQVKKTSLGVDIIDIDLTGGVAGR